MEQLTVLNTSPQQGALTRCWMPSASGIRQSNLQALQAETKAKASTVRARAQMYTWGQLAFRACEKLLRGRRAAKGQCESQLEQEARCRACGRQWAMRTLQQGTIILESEALPCWQALQQQNSFFAGNPCV